MAIIILNVMLCV